MPFNLTRAVLCVTLAVSQLNGAVAFTPNQSATGSRVSTEINMKTKPPAPVVASEADKSSYGEVSRQYRRTVYTHEEWVKHRSSDRFFRNLGSFSDSGIYKNLAKEVIATTSVAGVLLAWNTLFGDYQDLAGATHAGALKGVLPILALPLAPFTLSSPSLGLLLVFRTNTSYQRWDEARKNWGMNINHTRDLVRMGNAYYDRQAVSPERAQEDLDRLALCTWSFVRSMKRHLSPPWEDEEDFKKELLEKLPEQQAQKIIDAAHRPNRALQDLSTAIENLPMHFIRKNEVHAAATIFEDNLGSSERLLSSPVPVFYSRWTARFLSVWLLLLPLALWEPLGNSWNHIDILPITALLSIFLFGIEELATQLEEPFTILPMQGFCDKIYNWITEIATFTPGDNGMPVYTQPGFTPKVVATVNVDESELVETVEAKPVAVEEVEARPVAVAPVAVAPVAVAPVETEAVNGKKKKGGMNMRLLGRLRK